MVRAQLSSHYRGAARDVSSPHAPAALELSVFGQNDTLATGWLAIGPPIARTGVTFVLRGQDSVVLVTGSTLGDTIVWFSPGRAETLGGEYRVVAGQYAGQHGEWSLRPDPIAPTGVRILAVAGVALIIVIAIFLVGKRTAAAHWRGRLASPPAIPEKHERDWALVGGWLAWFVLGTAVAFIYQSIKIGEVASTIDDNMWMLGSAVSGFRSALFVESTFQLVQLLGIAVGFVLVFRRSPLAPTYWVAFLLALLIYGLYDIFAVPGFKSQLEAVLGTSLGAETEGEMETAAKMNSRLVVGAIIWSLYWMTSKRVFVRFAPREVTPTNVDAGVATSSGSTEAAQTE